MCDLLVPVVIVLLVSKRKTRMSIQVFWTALQFCMQHCDQSVNAAFENNRCLRKLFWDVTHFHWVTGYWRFEGSRCPTITRSWKTKVLCFSKFRDSITRRRSVIFQYKGVVNHTAIQTFKTHIIDVNFENRLKPTWICERSAERFGFKTLGNRSLCACERMSRRFDV